MNLYRTSVQHISNNNWTSIEHLSDAYRPTIEPLSNICTSRKTTEPLSNICRTPIEQQLNIYRTSVGKGSAGTSHNRRTTIGSAGICHSRSTTKGSAGICQATIAARLKASPVLIAIAAQLMRPSVFATIAISTAAIWDRAVQQLCLQCHLHGVHQEAPCRSHGRSTLSISCLFKNATHSMRAMHPGMLAAKRTMQE